ncbi:MAG TPA: oligopeptide transporter, OPT family, partial [Gammaproteobacteria bacterium]|nr:oligopeptide transporter, OPT family [Gammaproteobacteria bacterium]
VMGGESTSGPAAAIMIGAVVCVAAAIGGDNLQDLKAGYLVGATPWKQQVMLIVGVVASAFVMAPILNLLLNAYGIGPADPANPNSLLAPQATLMTSVAQGVFCLGSDDANCKALPWGMVGLGAIIGVGIIALDEYLRVSKANWRAPVLAVAVGIYLPLELATPIFLGGLVAWLAKRYSERKLAREQQEHNERTGMLFAAGLITGEALIGILMAIPIVLSSQPDVLAIADEPWGSVPGIILILALAYGLYRIGTMKKQP